MHLSLIVLLEAFGSMKKQEFEKPAVTVRAVEAWVTRGHVTTVKADRYRTVNGSVLVAQAGPTSLKIRAKATVLQANALQKSKV